MTGVPEELRFDRARLRSEPMKSKYTTPSGRIVRLARPRMSPGVG
jgi:hypothetical protein